MYNDLFSIGPVTVHSYGLFTAIGLIAAILLASARAKKRGMSEDICYGILFSGVIFGYFCSKLTYVCVEWDSFIKDPKLFLSQSGFVVIGGLAGGVLAAWVYCRIKKVKFIDYFDLSMPSVAIAQGFGRIGCFMAGCCYGKETDSPIGIAFTHSNFANMALLLLIAKKAKKKGLVAAVYMLTYSVGRFLIEYLRNDERGVIGPFSTSQFFSLIIFVVGIIFFVLVLLKGEAVEPYATEEKETVTDKESNEEV